MGRRDGELWGQSRLKYGDVFAISLRKALWLNGRGQKCEVIGPCYGRTAE